VKPSNGLAFSRRERAAQERNNMPLIAPRSGRMHARVSPLAVRLWTNMVGTILHDHADLDGAAYG